MGGLQNAPTRQVLLRRAPKQVTAADTSAVHRILVAQVMLAVQHRNPTSCRPVKFHSGLVEFGGRRFKFGVNGVADILCFCAGGICVHIEAKTGRRPRLSDAQLVWQTMCRDLATHHITAYARTADDVPTTAAAVAETIARLISEYPWQPSPSSAHHKKTLHLIPLSPTTETLFPEMVTSGSEPSPKTAPRIRRSQTVTCALSAPMSATANSSGT